MTMTSQKCKWCNCELTESQIKGGKKYCSVSCYRSMQRSGAYSGVKEPAHKNRCFTCGAETNKRPSQRRNGDLAEKVFCCRECYLKRAKSAEVFSWFRHRHARRYAKHRADKSTALANARYVVLSFRLYRQGEAADTQELLAYCAQARAGQSS